MKRPHRIATDRIGQEDDTLQPYIKKNGIKQVNEKYIDKYGTDTYKEYDTRVEKFYKGRRKYL